MNIAKLAVAIVVLFVLVCPIKAADAELEVGAVGGYAMAADNVTLIVAVTAKTELVYIDTLTGKEKKKVKVEFQPTILAMQGEVLFAAQKGAGVVHVLDADGTEIGTGKVGAAVKQLVCHRSKGPAYASTENREVYAIDKKGTVTKTKAQGVLIAVDPSEGAFVCTVVEGRVRTDLMKYKVDGNDLASEATLQSVTAGNAQMVGISADGKQVGVAAGGGWSGADRKRHYAVPVYDVADMKTMLGDMEGGRNGFAYHPVLPVAVAVGGGINSGDSLFSTKSLAPTKKVEGPGKGVVIGAPAVLTFGAKGKKLIYGVTNMDKTTIKFIDLELSKEEQDALDKAYSK